MNMDRADGRRVIVATIITLFALPSLWLMNRDDPSGPATVTPGGVTLSADSNLPEPTATAPRHQALGSVGGAYLSRPEVAPERSRTAGEPIPVAVPAARPGQVVSERATYRGSIPDPRACLVADAPYSARVTITNVDNGRSYTCVASVSPLGTDDRVVLHTDAFTQIAHLSDAPIPVEITW